MSARGQWVKEPGHFGGHPAERNVWEFARPATVIVTTPNREYNARFETLTSPWRIARTREGKPMKAWAAAAYFML